MVDRLSIEERSWLMSRIRSQETSPEMLLRKALWTAGLRYRLKNKLPGKPDLVFPSAKVAVFVDGCFWHSCSRHATQPKNNAAFWEAKLLSNKARDRKVNRLLRNMGWQVVRIWEHELATPERVVTRITQALRITGESNPRRP